MRGSVLNPPGTAKIRSYPHGLIFDYVLCPDPRRSAPIREKNPQNPDPRQLCFGYAQDARTASKEQVPLNRQDLMDTRSTYSVCLLLLFIRTTHERISTRKSGGRSAEASVLLAGGD
jgi:hypothetical protein